MSKVVFSRWRPDEGGYDYFVAPGAPNINDDLPRPELPAATRIGVPSIEAGRAIPAYAVPAGHGEEARGLLAPVDPTRIVRRTRSLGEASMSSMGVGPWFWVGVAGAAVITFVVWKQIDGS